MLPHERSRNAERGPHRVDVLLATELSHDDTPLQRLPRLGRKHGQERRPDAMPPVFLEDRVGRNVARRALQPILEEDRLRVERVVAFASQPLPPQVASTGGPAMNTEYFLGSEAEERAQFAAFAREIQAIQRKAASEHDQPIQRGFHAKSHACLNGELRLDHARDPRTRFGIFADDGPPKRVVARFSNRVGWKQGDADLDARGLAIKVLDVPGPKYLDDEPTSQDILMTNSPVPVGRDAVEFMKFAHANVKGRTAGLCFLVGHAAFHLGAHQAVKLTTRPCDLRLVREPRRDTDDYLRADLVAAARDGVCMALYIQLEADPVRTPNENASKIWEESDSPLVPVGRIVMPPQVVDPGATAACDQLAFSPWHSLPAHKPMGHINRARRFVYAASQQQRANR